MERFNTSCNFETDKTPIRHQESTKTKYYDNSLIMRAHPSSTLMNEQYPVVINKLNKSQFFNIQTHYGYKCANSGDELCFIPQFVQQMDDSMFARIDGVVDFNLRADGGKSGWFLILNINGAPKGCFTFEKEDISEEVRH